LNTFWYSPYSKLPQSGIVFKAGVGLTITTADVLPIDKGIARSHQGLIDVGSPLKDFGNTSAITISCFDLEGYLRSDRQQTLQCFPCLHSIWRLRCLWSINAGKTHFDSLVFFCHADGVSVANRDDRSC